ncbi:gp53-like domain-containing protein, partial [Klebsiella pneumoniae]
GRIFTDFTMCNCFSKNLGLGEAAKREVGTGTNQLPDMSGFTRNLVNNGWQKFPGGLVIQWGMGGMPAGVLTGDVTFPIAFPSTVFAILATDTGGASVPYGTTNRSKTGFTLTRTSSSGAGNVNGFYLAIGA